MKNLILNPLSSIKFVGLIGLFIVSIHSQLVMADSTAENREYLQLKIVKSCIETLRSANDRHQVILRTWFDPSSKLDISSNFAILNSQHQKHFDEIANFSRIHGNLPSDMSGLATAIAFLDRQHEDILYSQTKTQDGDEIFAQSLSSIDEGLHQLGGEYLAAKNICISTKHPQIDSAIESIKSLRFQILNLRTYIREAEVKRSLLFTAVLQGLKTRHLKAFSETAHASLEGLETKINSILAADSLYARIQTWWSEASITNGFGRGNLTRDLQFSESLRVLRSDAQIGFQFQSELASLQNLSPAVRDTVKSELDLYVKMINDQIKSLEVNGYQSVFSRQKLLSSQRKSLISRYGLSCQEAINAFEQAVSSVRDFNSFSEIEPIYKRQSRACMGD